MGRASHRPRAIRRFWQGLILWLAALAAATPAQAYRAAVVVEAESGAVLQAENVNLRSFPASTTKLMTLYLAFAALEAGALALDEALPVSARAAGQGGQSLGLRAGGTIAAREAILGVIVESANDAAVVLAERIGGSEDAFAAQMTATARRLGMTRTAFRNASGLSHPEQTTTARDLALLAMAHLRDFPGLYPLFATRSFRHGGETFTTVNGLLVNYGGADGLKTGFTCAAGYNLVASAVRGGRRLVAVVLGETSRAARALSIARLLDRGFATARPDTDRTLAGIEPTTLGEPDPPARGVIAEACAGIVAVASAGAPTVLRGGGWSIAVGGLYESQQRATQMAQRIQALNPMLFRGARSTVIRAARGGSVLFRPLILGLDGRSAGNACTGLSQQGIACTIQNPARLTSAVERSALLETLVVRGSGSALR